MGTREALAYFTDPALRKRTLDYTLSRQTSVSQDAPRLIEGCSRSRKLHDGWNYVKANWDALLEKSLGVFQGLPAIAKSVANFCDQPTRDDLKAFFDAYLVLVIDRPIRQSLEKPSTAASRRKNQQEPNLAAFLR